MACIHTGTFPGHARVWGRLTGFEAILETGLRLILWPWGLSWPDGAELERPLDSVGVLGCICMRNLCISTRHGVACKFWYRSKSRSDLGLTTVENQEYK